LTPPGLAEKEPVSHGVHKSEPGSGLTHPAGHWEQVAEDMAAEALEKVPVGQRRQLENGWPASGL
jgi:hypothetical protein